MSQRALGVVVPVVLGLLGASVVLLIDYQANANSDGDKPLLIYFTELPARISESLNGDPTPPTIADLLPKPAFGWTARAYVREDYHQLTQIPPVDPADIDPGVAAVQEAIDNNLGAQIVKAQLTSGFDREAMTFENGEEMIIVSISYRPVRAFNQLGGAQLGMMHLRPDATPFGVINGLPFEVSPIGDSDVARRIVGRMGRQLDFELVTNTDDAAAMSLLEQLDLDAFNLLINEPIPGVGSAAGG